MCENGGGALSAEDWGDLTLSCDLLRSPDATCDWMLMHLGRISNLNPLCLKTVEIISHFLKVLHKI